MRSGNRNRRLSLALQAAKRCGEWVGGFLLLRAGEEVDDDLGVAGGVEDVASFFETQTQGVVVDQVAVVGEERDLAADEGFEEGLGVAGERAAGRGVAVVPDLADAALFVEVFERARIEILGDEAHAGDSGELVAGDGDAR